MTQTNSETGTDALPETMRAVVCHGPEDYRLEEVAVPTPGPGEALVRVEAVGICASDLKCYHGAAKFWGDENRPAWAETEVIPGHEFVGEVVALDQEATDRWGIAVGDRVVSEQIVPCWKCRYCLRGQYWMCGPHDMYGFKRRNPGGMAQYMVYPVAGAGLQDRARTCHRRTPRSPSRCRAPCTPWSAPTSSSRTSWSSPGAGRSAWA